MSDRLRSQVSPISLSFICVMLGALNISCANAWQTRASDSDSETYTLVAFETNARGDTSEIYRNDNDQVFLRVSLAAGFIKFSPSNCPTLQIDKRVPVHHYQTGPNCTLTTDSVNVLLATVTNNLATSLPLYRLMNGSKLAVRFVTSSGEYRESLFTLKNSKQAMKAAIGDKVQVEPEARDNTVSNEASP